MSEKRTRNRFRGDLWLEQQVDQRVKAALREKQEAFEQAHQEDTEEQLLDYVRQEAAKLRYTPNPGDLIGGPYIYKRFGSWDRVVALCGLPKPGKMPPMKSRTIYKEEYKRQLELFRQEHKAEQKIRSEAVQVRKEQAKLEEEQTESSGQDAGARNGQAEQSDSVTVTPEINVGDWEGSIDAEFDFGGEETK